MTFDLPALLGPNNKRLGKENSTNRTIIFDIYFLFSFFDPLISELPMKIQRNINIDIESIKYIPNRWAYNYKSNLIIN